MRGLVLVLLVGCGGQDWSGHYSGQATVAGSCSDGSGGSRAIADSLTLTQVGDDISFPLGCGIIGHATIHGDTASLVPAACPRITDSSGISDKSYSDGTLKLLGDKLSLNITEIVSDQGPNRTRTTCSSVETGSLTLVP